MEASHKPLDFTNQLHIEGGYKIRIPNLDKDSTSISNQAAAIVPVAKNNIPSDFTSSKISLVKEPFDINKFSITIVNPRNDKKYKNIKNASDEKITKYIKKGHQFAYDDGTNLYVKEGCGLQEGKLIRNNLGEERIIKFRSDKEEEAFESFLCTRFPFMQTPKETDSKDTREKELHPFTTPGSSIHLKAVLDKSKPSEKKKEHFVTPLSNGKQIQENAEVIKYDKKTDELHDTYEYYLKIDISKKNKEYYNSQMNNWKKDHNIVPFTAPPAA